MKQKVGKKITELRKLSEQTQQQLAQALNVSSAAVSKWENGISEPDISTICAIADHFRISVDDLLEHNPNRKRALIFLYSDRGGNEAHRAISKRGFDVVGITSRFSELESLLKEEANIDFLITVAFSTPGEYISGKIDELKAMYHFRHMACIQSEEDQIEPLLGMLLNTLG